MCCSRLCLGWRFILQLLGGVEPCRGALFSFLKSSSPSCEQNGTWCLMKAALQWIHNWLWLCGAFTARAVPVELALPGAALLSPVPQGVPGTHSSTSSSLLIGFSTSHSWRLFKLLRSYLGKVFLSILKTVSSIKSCTRMRVFTE